MIKKGKYNVTYQLLVCKKECIPMTTESKILFTKGERFILWQKLIISRFTK